MIVNKYRLSPILLLFLLLQSCLQTSPEVKDPGFTSPEISYGKLFTDVQLSNPVFHDSKTFVDCIPRRDIPDILEAYGKLENKNDSIILRDFIESQFIIPGEQNGFVSDSSEITTHITKLWDRLTRPADTLTNGSLVPLPNPYVVPGGRFRELYYWDSYFTMLGLLADGRKDLIRNMIGNFSHLIRTLGHIPNGTRSYYLSRSQPPFYSLMLDILGETDGESVLPEYRATLEAEYNFWMAGATKAGRKEPCVRRVVKMEDGSLLNRYWDDQETPRPESYREDIATADMALSEHPELSPEQVFRDLRAAAESGWDFSSRWMKQEPDGSYRLASIHTTDIVPIDLNCLLFHMEESLARIYALEGNSVKAETYNLKAINRKEAILKYCWNEGNEFFMDYDHSIGKSTSVLSLAGLYPLFFGIATEDRARQVSEKLCALFLMPGGLVTTLNETGEQWDAPNGWPPLQYICIKGLRNYGYYELAEEIANRWMRLIEKEYYRSYKLLEKYNVVDMEAEGGGGEYPNQDGFGWTNGVYQYLSSETDTNVILTE